MNKQDDQEVNSQQSQIDDLTVNQDQAAVVKGGVVFPVYRSVEGDVTSNEVIHKVIET